MFETGGSLSLNKIQALFLRKYCNLHSIKQNEKHPYQINNRIWKGKCENPQAVGEIRAEDGRLPKSLEVHSKMPKSRPDSSQHKAQDHSKDSQRYIHSEEG